MKITAVDLFCGAGGTSTGLEQACKERGIELELIAINHWATAIHTHSVNHPKVRHLCEPIELLKPKEVVRGPLNVLIASPECTHHSNARGGKPINDQSRSTAWRVLEWTEALRPDWVLIENVPEFRTWGRLTEGGRPSKARKGGIYVQFLHLFREFGYEIDDRVLNAADYGDPTTRKRLFIVARKQDRYNPAPVAWPEPTHCDPKKMTAGTLIDELPLKPWRPAREIIDWSIESRSIFGRKRPLARKTLERIYAGLEKFGGPNAEPFLLVLRQHMDGLSIDGPVPTVAASGNHVGLVTPIVLRYHKGDSRTVDQPIPTQTQTECFAVVEPTAMLLPPRKFRMDNCDDIDLPARTIDGNAKTFGLVEPMVVPQFGQCPAKSTEEPLGAITTTSRGIGVAQGFLTRFNQGANRNHEVNDPLPSVDTANRYGVVEPVIIGQGGSEYAGKPKSVSDPVGTISTQDHRAVVEPFLVPNYGERDGQDPRVHGLQDPVPTIPASGGGKFGLTEPFIVDVTHGNGKEDPAKAAARRSDSIDDPMRTITGAHGKALTTPIILETPDGRFGLDIRLRMLTPRELASAMSFPADYEFLGNKEDQVRQIGNAVPVSIASALTGAILDTYAPQSLQIEEEEERVA